MNYLAHVFLSCDNEAVLLGNFMADMIKNSEYHLLDDDLKLGVELHRKIDSYTDQHKATRRVTAVLRNRHHKYAPVVADVLFDYIFAKNWSKYSDIPLDIFIKKTYDKINKNLHRIPERVRPRVERMINGKFLHKSVSIEGLIYTFEKLDIRTKFKSDFTTALVDLEINQDLIEENFHLLFQDLVSEVSLDCKC